MGRSPLHGRRAELDALEAWLERARSGTLQTVLIEGEAGIGKTSVLDAALLCARERGFRVLAGRADEVERARPFGALAEALRGLAGPELGRLLSVEPGAGPLAPWADPGLQFRVVDACVELVEEAALAGPVVLAVDDLQWADASTILALRSLGRRLVDLPVGMLMTVRPSPRGSELERYLAALAREGAHRLQLGALDEQAVLELVRQLVGEEPRAALVTKVRGAAGNPLFVGELVAALGDASEAELADTSLPPSLRLTILRRLGFLEEETLDLLRLASVFGSTFSMRDVAIVSARPLPDLLGAVRDAVRAGLLEDHEGRLRFRHDLIREAVYGDLPEDVRSTLHLDAGRRLAAAGAPALRVAEQVARGARPGDSDVVSWLHDAGRQAARSDPSIAVELLQRALELTDLPVPILADLVPALLWSGRPQEAEARAREALASGAASELEGPLRLGLVQALSAQGRDRELIEEVSGFVDRLDLTPDLRSRLLAEAANALDFLEELEEAEAAAREAVTIGTPVQSEGAEMGLLVLSDIARVRGRLHEALEHGEDALRRAEARGASRVHRRPEIFIAMALRNLDRFDDALEAIDRGRRADEQHGNVAYLPVYHYESATVLFFAGRWDEAVVHAEAGLALADDVGLRMLHHWPYGILALVAVHQGDLRQAAAWLAEAPPAGFAGMIASALLDEARGDAAGAFAALARAWDFDAGRGVVGIRRLVAPELVRVALASGDRAYAASVAAGIAEAAATTSLPSLDGVALRCRGLAEGDPGLLAQAVEAYRHSPRVFERALAAEDAAGALGRSGCRPQAAALFDEALDVYGELGARQDAGRALATMRELGLGRKRRGARKRPATGWEALTPSELEVVMLAAEGLTNPEIGRRLFISSRTVQTHLKHVFQKLGISSRVELAALAARRALEHA